MGKKLTTEEFIEKANSTHKNKYDYSKLQYSTNYADIIIKCPSHGYFRQRAGNHIYKKCGCPRCSFEATGVRFSKGIDKFVKQSILVHGNKYDYSKVNYFTTHFKVEIVCPFHGSFLQSPATHIRGVGCPKCAGNIKYTTEEFISKAKQIHGNKYDYSEVTYNGNKRKVIICCRKHGEFLQKPNYHLSLKQGCPRCNTSNGENVISKFLIDNKIKYISQKTFDDCKNPKSRCKLKFDFYIPNKNLLIEYDGRQHYKIGSFIKGRHITTKKELKEMQFRDNIRNKYAKQNGIKLLRIKYTKFNQIDKILIKELSP